MTSEPMTKDTCEARHQGLDRYLATLEAKMDAIDRKMWAIILLVGANVIDQLFTVVAAHAGSFLP